MDFDRSLSNSDKKKLLIEFCKKFFETNKTKPKIKDFEKLNIWASDIRRIFGGNNKLYISCNLKEDSRHALMSDEEIKEFLKKIRTTDSSDTLMPLHRGKTSICYEQCSCWITDQLYTDPIRKITRITYKGKTTYLHRLSYMLFKGPIAVGKVIGHKCDNSMCYNPDHLEAISQKQNVQDSVHRQRRVYDNYKSAASRSDRYVLKLKDPYDYTKLLALVKQRVTISPKNEWLYNKGTTRDGYSEIVISGKKYKLHRLLLANKIGKKYEDIEIARHILLDGSKPNKNDVNPDHLFEGSQKDNAQDVTYRKNITLTENQVKEIKEKIRITDFSMRGSIKIFDRNTAAQYGVAQDVISGIRQGRTYGYYGPKKQ